MNEKKARFLRKLLATKEVKNKLPYLQVKTQAGNERGIIRDEEYFLQLKFLKRKWVNASIFDKQNFLNIIKKRI